VLLARSHRWIYVSPVGGRNVEQKSDDGEGERDVVYYRIFAKEQGSSTDVSLSSTGLSGCNHKIYVKDMHSPVSCAVRIEPLKGGERYVFASAGYNKSDQVVGPISPTSSPIDAVNPLPTILLWGYLSQISAVDMPEICRDSARRVYINKYIYIYVYVYICVCLCTYIFIYIYIYMHIYM
jgi:hypothetical protein